ncbi:hypothetical protein N658DRAFT_422231 [Parathielavia hyrcaniae]|uniref:Uncharacterized protein n=1 Tax=Parathielavia hyrcaniae TaxID=113614 RepID=A0AAN6T3X6_9PEZI|nr:hypothetical protein N658DRAFT_422231 [Parathielavia hyrcaniae]
METVFCECKKCDAPIGRFFNLWTQIGKSYFSPVVEPEDDLAIQFHGAFRIGEHGTLVEGCQLQDIICRSCAALLGLRCIQIPVNHVLEENQLLLRLASVDLLDADGQEIEFAIKRVLSVNAPSKMDNGKPDPTQRASFSSAASSAELQQLQADLHIQREDIKRIDSNGFRIVSALDKRAARVEGQVKELKVTVPGIQRDIGGLQQQLGAITAEIGQLRESTGDNAVISGLEDRLTSVTSNLVDVGHQVATLDAQLQKAVSELKSELNRQRQHMEDLRLQTRGSVAVDDHTQDVAALRTEMAQLRRQLDETRSQGVGRAGTVFPSRELDVLTSNIAKIGNRASQVETLQMEVEILKGRVERAEAGSQVDERRTSRPIAPGDLTVYSDIFPVTRKRAASPGLAPSLKRPASSLGYSDSTDRRYATPNTWPAIQPTTGFDDVPANHGTTHTPNSARGGAKSSRSRTTGTWNGISTRLRKR